MNEYNWFKYMNIYSILMNNKVKRRQNENLRKFHFVVQSIDLKSIFLNLVDPQHYTQYKAEIDTCARKLEIN